MVIGCYFGLDVFGKKNHFDNDVTIENVNFFKLLVQNITFALTIILGAFTFNILTTLLSFYNGFIFGMFLNNTLINFGMKKTFLLFFSHSIIEIVWIILSIKLSYEIFLYFNKYIIESNRVTVLAP